MGELNLQMPSITIKFALTCFSFFNGHQVLTLSAGAIYDQDTISLPETSVDQSIDQNLIIWEAFSEFLSYGAL